MIERLANVREQLAQKGGLVALRADPVADRHEARQPHRSHRVVLEDLVQGVAEVGVLLVDAVRSEILVVPG